MPSFNYTLVLALQRRKNTGNPNVPAKCKAQFVLPMYGGLDGSADFQPHSVKALSDLLTESNLSARPLIR